MFYVSVGLPLGYLADAVNRHVLLVTGILVWSAVTIGSGFARGFGDLFMARPLVGMGEAVLAPCAVGMISEMFPPERRSMCWARWRPLGLMLRSAASFWALRHAALLWHGRCQGIWHRGGWRSCWSACPAWRWH